MKDPLSASEAKSLIAKAEGTFRHEDCATCECYLGYVAQIVIDSGPGAKQFLQDYLPDKSEIHSCLGCDPCAPGILYATYLRKRPKE